MEKCFQNFSFSNTSFDYYNYGILLFKGYFDALRMEVNEHNIAVTLVCPGPVQTDVVANAFTEDVNKVWPYCTCH